MSEHKPEINVRAMNSDDWRALYEIWTDPRVCRGMLMVPYQSEDEVREKVENPPQRMVRMVAELDGRVVGSSTLRMARSPRMQHVANCGLSVHADYWNQGVGSALLSAILDLADNWLNLKRLELEVYVDNEAAIHLYEKFGFEIEGTMRKSAFRDGEFVDAHAMARVRD